MGAEPWRGGHPKIASRIGRAPDERRRLEAAARFGVAPSVYDGRVVRERHTHYDSDGAVTGYTVVEREPEWQEIDRHEAEGLLYYEATRCGNCGNDLHVTLETDEDGKHPHAWDVDNTTVCWSCASVEMVKRTDQNAHRDDKPRAGKPMYMDGRLYTATQYIE